MHIMRHCEEFRESLTEEEARYWNEAFEGKSLFDIWREYGEEKKRARKEAKKAEREARQQKIKIENHPFMRSMVEKISDCNIPSDEDEGPRTEEP